MENKIKKLLEEKTKELQMIVVKHNEAINMATELNKKAIEKNGEIIALKQLIEKDDKQKATN